MEADVLNALASQAAYLPGGRDSDGNLLLIVNVPCDVQPWSKQHLELSVNYLLASLSAETLSTGLSAIVDAQKCNWRVARLQIRHVSALLGENLRATYVIRPEAFWEKQRVENCAKAHKKDEPFILSKSRLLKHFDMAELPLELGGTFAYNHDDWIQNRTHFEEFKKSYEKAINDLDNLHIVLLDNKSIRASEIETTLKTCSTLNSDVQQFIQTVMENGNKFISHLNDLQTSTSSSVVSQDLLDATESVKTMLNEIELKQSQITVAWTELEKSIDDVRELAALEDGVGYVTNWILVNAESMLNAQLRVGYDVQTSEKLRLDHELLEMQCWKTYGYYAELLYKIDNIPALKSSFAHIDLMSQRDFMDFVCRSFATRLERRRNILISSVRFYRLVSEYFERTSAVFESLIMGDKVDDYDMAKLKLQKLKDSQHTLDHIEKELNREGEKLSDVLAMPIKDALGREIVVDYSDDIANIRDILDATIARRNIFIDSVELQKLTLEQITFIHTYEKDAQMAITWMDDLYKVMIKSHTHVGCNIREIQLQKDEHQAFQETAKGTYNYGCQLLSAALSLRQACKLTAERNAEMLNGLQQTWKHFQLVSQEQMTRLRVSAVFHRSVAEHCSKLYDLQTIVHTLNEIECQEKRKTKLRKYLSSREKLLLEVGRMVRLGRLLKSRLREPFRLSERSEDLANQENIIISTSDNTVACDAIMEKLTEVSRIAESLDHVLKNTKASIESADSDETSGASVVVGKKTRSNNNSDDWGSSIKSSTEDESFVTASDSAGTPQSRSSSYHTASECRGSPWWDATDRNSIETETSDIDTEGPSLRLLTGVISSANISFDESETSYRTAMYTTSELTDSDDARKLVDTDPTAQPHDESDKQTISSAGDNLSDTASTDNMLTPTTSSNETLDRVSVDDEAAGADTNAKLTDNEMSGLSFYYQNIITNQAVKTCL